MAVGNLTVNATGLILRYTHVSGVDVADSAIGPITTNFAGSAPAGSYWTPGTASLTNTGIGTATWSSTTRYASFTSGADQCTTAGACATTIASGGSLSAPSFTFNTAANSGDRTRGFHRLPSHQWHLARLVRDRIGWVEPDDVHDRG